MKGRVGRPPFGVRGSIWCPHDCQMSLDLIDRSANVCEILTSEFVNADVQLRQILMHVQLMSYLKTSFTKSSKIKCVLTSYIHSCGTNASAVLCPCNGSRRGPMLLG